MKLTFGICSTYENIPQLSEVVESIRALNIPKYEILIAGVKPHGLTLPTFPNTWHLAVDGWLPQKKNTIAKVAQYDTLVLLHDYYLFDPMWYKSYSERTGISERFDICSNPQYLIDGTRHATDWITWDHPTLGRYWSLPYDDWSNTKYQYISGGFFIVRRQFLVENPLNESMPPGSPEDVEWSLRVREKAYIKCNPFTWVKHNKRHRDVGNKSFPYYSMARM